MARSAVDETTESGAFNRHQPSTILFRKIRHPSFLQNLEDIICIYHMHALGHPDVYPSSSSRALTGNLLHVKPKWERTKETDEHFGWVFPVSSTEESGVEPDHLKGAKSIRELYELASSNYSGKSTVPVVAKLYQALDKCEGILANQRYICGNVLTEADIRLFITVTRFDEVYAVHFKCNKKLLREYPYLFNYTKDIYQTPGMSSTVHMDHTKKHYYGSHPTINPYGIILIGSNADFSSPHDQKRFGH